MQKTERTTITLPNGLRDRAHYAKINISGIASDAVLHAVKEKETGMVVAKQNTPAAASVRRASECQHQTC